MGLDVAERYPAARGVFDAADEALGFGLSEMIFHGDGAELNLTENTQPALLTTCAALSAVLVANGVGPDAAAGLSVGEYAAHVLSGTFGFTDAVRAVRKRGAFMQGEVPVGEGGMAAIFGLDPETVEWCCNQAPARTGDASLVAEPANFNCPGQIVISGHTGAVGAACEICKEKGAKRAVPLAVSAPFHCSLMRGAADKLEAELSAIRLNAMRVPVYSNVTAERVTDASVAAGLLVRQVASPVRWEQCVRNMLAAGVSRFVEVGPGKVLAGFIRKIDVGAEVVNVFDAASMENALARLV